MIKLWLSAGLALGLLGTLALAQVSRSGSCPSGVGTMEDFNVTRYMGKWYENRKYPFMQEMGGKCITAEYTMAQSGVVDVVNSEVNIYTEILTSVIGNATVVDGAKLKVTFPMNPAVDVSSNYWVLATDYSSYSVVYACYDVPGNMSAVALWILTREATPSYTVVDKAYEVLRANDIDVKLLEATDQTCA